MNATKLAAIAIVALIPSIGHAAASHASMPKELYGAWCPSSDNTGKGLNANGFNNKVDKYTRTTGHNRTDIKCSEEKAC
jgi:hypothetical protein